MRFFNQTERSYFNNFIYQHHQCAQTYFTPFTTEKIFQWLKEEPYKSAYFFIRGWLALYKAGVSLCKAIYALVTFSFTEAKSAALNSGCYLASWIIKQGFCLLLSCLSLVQFLCKALSSCLFGLIMAVTQNAPRKRQVKEQMYRVGEEINLLGADMHEVNSQRKLMLEEMDRRFEQLSAWKLKRSVGHIVFEPDHVKQAKFMNEELQALHQQLVLGLSSYPQAKNLKATDQRQIINFHQTLLEHHHDVCELAAAFFKKFDSYLDYQITHSLTGSPSQQFSV